jgi:hypothetical protein
VTDQEGTVLTLKKVRNGWVIAFDEVYEDEKESTDERVRVCVRTVECVYRPEDRKELLERVEALVDRGPAPLFGFYRPRNPS